MGYINIIIIQLQTLLLEWSILMQSNFLLYPVLEFWAELFLFAVCLYKIGKFKCPRNACQNLLIKQFTDLDNSVGVLNRTQKMAEDSFSFRENIHVVSSFRLPGSDEHSGKEPKFAVLSICVNNNKHRAYIKTIMSIYTTDTDDIGKQANCLVGDDQSMFCAINKSGNLLLANGTFNKGTWKDTSVQILQTAPSGSQPEQYADLSEVCQNVLGLTVTKEDEVFICVANDINSGKVVKISPQRQILGQFSISKLPPIIITGNGKGEFCIKTKDNKHYIIINSEGNVVREFNLSDSFSRFLGVAYDNYDRLILCTSNKDGSQSLINVLDSHDATCLKSFQIKCSNHNSISAVTVDLQDRIWIGTLQGEITVLEYLERHSALWSCFYLQHLKNQHLLYHFKKTQNFYRFKTINPKLFISYIMFQFKCVMPKLESEFQHIVHELKSKCNIYYYADRLPTFFSKY